MKRIYIALSLICVLVSLAGCAKDDLKLVHVAPPRYSALPPETPSVCVVRVEDARLVKDLGVNSNGQPFSSGSDVSGWVTHALAAEMTRNNLIVSVVSAEGDIPAGEPWNVLKARLEEIWLTENSAFSYTCSMRISVELYNSRKALLMKNTFNTSLSRKVVPLSSAPEEMLKETLEELVSPIGVSVAQKLRPSR